VEYDTLNASKGGKGGQMKIFLDNMRDAPEGWLAVHWPDDAILLLAQGEVTELSVDHEFGRGLRGTADTLFDWLTTAITTRALPVPKLIVHSSNSTQQARLQARADEIAQLTPVWVEPVRAKKPGKPGKDAESAPSA